MQDSTLGNNVINDDETSKNNSTSVYWCENCSVPLLTDFCNICNNHGKRIGSSLKPVFRDEYLMFKEKIMNSSNLQERYFPWILYRRRNYLIGDTTKGEVFSSYNITTKGSFLYNFNVKLTKNFKSNRSEIKKDSHFLDDLDYQEKLVKANLPTLEKLEGEAIEFIQKTIKQYPKYKIVASFSGGKDSLITTSLLKSATTHKFDIVYSNTGIEFDETTKYIERYMPNFGNLVHLKAKRDFLELCKELGPPSRMMRWCCFTQKGAPINDYYSQIKSKVLSFDGIRRDESNLRRGYPRIKENTKITKQLSVYPIIEWSELAVWLYIFWKKLEYNPIYDKGFARCGCWACPNNSQFDWYLLRRFYPNKFDEWRYTLTQYTKEEGRYDHSWIWDGSWKSRKVQYKDVKVGEMEDNNDPFLSNDDSVTDEETEINGEFKEKKICLENEDFLITLDEKISKKMIEFLKPFGKLSEVKIKGKVNWLITGKYVNIKIPKNSSLISVEVINEDNFPKIKKYLERQIVKALNCVDCAACTNSCKYGAIDFSTKEFRIIDEKCSHCLECCTTKYLVAGCVALHYKSKRKKLEK